MSDASNDTLRLYRRLGGSAAGRWLFSKLVGLRAPYFRSIDGRVVELAPGRCVARLRQRWRVQNHIGTVHAIACCNLAELAAGLATEAAMTPRIRWIPKGMTVRYRKKATGELTATAQLPPLDENAAADVVVPVAITDRHGDTVVDADITMYVSPRKS
jgi:acyl-coenzyme A thioesterase PaaI-like protein